MTLAPLAAAPAIIQIHVAAALLALLAGLAIMLLRKGTALHRRVGWVFVPSMAVVALSSIFITRNGEFSAIHLLTLVTIVTLPRAILLRRRGDIGGHKRAMISLVLGLAVAGAFTLVPGRLMHQVALGQAPAAR